LFCTLGSTVTGPSPVIGKRFVDEVAADHAAVDLGDDTVDGR
jgi:hypothetical protein